MIKGYSDAFLNTGNVKHFFPHVGFYNLYERWLLLIIKIQGLDIKLTLLGDINKLHWKVKGHLKMLDYSFSFFTFFFDFYVRILCFQNGFLLFKSAYSSLRKSEIRIHNCWTGSNIRFNTVKLFGSKPCPCFLQIQKTFLFMPPPSIEQMFETEPDLERRPSIHCSCTFFRS